MEKGTSGTSSYALAVEGIILLLGISLSARPVPNPTLHTNYVRLMPPKPAVVATSSMLPPVVAPHNRYATNVFHFAATCYTTNAESFFSPECLWTNISTNYSRASVTLAWDPSKDPTVIGYKLYSGTIAFQYPTNWDAGSSTTITVNPYPSSVVLKRYIKVRWFGTGSNIWATGNPGYPFTPVYYPTNEFTLTNPTQDHVYWKATNIVITNWTAP